MTLKQCDAGHNHELENLVRGIAMDAFAFIGRNSFEGDQQADIAVEAFIINSFRNSGMSVKLVSEESGTISFGSPTQTIVVDPIDGTGNLIRGIPIYSVAMAICDSTEALVSFSDIAYSIVASSFGVFEGRKGEDHISTGIRCDNIDEALVRQARQRRMRLLGASTVELCLLARGNIDGFVELEGLKCVDLIPVLLNLHRHDCPFSDARGAQIVFDLALPKNDIYTFIAARSEKLHELLVESTRLARLE